MIPWYFCILLTLQCFRDRHDFPSDFETTNIQMKHQSNQNTHGSVRSIDTSTVEAYYQDRRKNNDQSPPMIPNQQNKLRHVKYKSLETNASSEVSVQLG